MEKNYFIQQFLTEEYMDGGITCVDAEKILMTNGFTPVSFPHHSSFSLKAKMARFFFLLRTVLFIKRNSVVVFLFPAYARMSSFLLRLLRIKGIKIICIIADIDGIRDADDRLLKKEINQLRRYRYLVVHNNKMKSLIERLVPGSVCTVVHFFDFLVEPPDIERIRRNSIVFAGNLKKSIFLSLLNHASFSNLHFNIYGPGISEEVTRYKNISYYGVHKPYDMPSLVQGSFGLIWDGESIDSCLGGHGEYLRYNSQHKLSLYVLSGLPVIIWDEAATAELVIEHRIGFTIKNLHEIEERINTLSEREYRQMQANMRPLAEKISKGQCLGEAIAEIMKRLQNN